MIEEQAVVVSVDEDKVVVQAAVKSTCSGCVAKTNCGTGAVARAFSHRVQQLELHSPVPVNVGDNVVIGIQENGVVLASWLIYLAPLLVFFLSIIACTWLFGESLHEMLMLLIALVPTWWSFRQVASYCQGLDKGRFQPVLLRRC